MDLNSGQGKGIWCLRDTHEIQKCKHRRCRQFGLRFFATHQQVEQIVVCQIHQFFKRVCLPEGKARCMPIKETGDEQVVFE